MFVKAKSKDKKEKETSKRKSASGEGVRGLCPPPLCGRPWVSKRDGVAPPPPPIYGFFLSVYLTSSHYLHFCSYVRKAIEGEKALAEMSAKNASIFDGSP